MRTYLTGLIIIILYTFEIKYGLDDVRFELIILVVE